MVLTCEICDELIHCEEIKAILDSILPPAENLQLKRKKYNGLNGLSTMRSMQHMQRVGCNECHKTSNNKKALQSHKNTYHRKAASADLVSEKTRLDQIALKRLAAAAVRSVQAMERVKCNDCHKLFKNKESLFAHKRRYHRKVKAAPAVVEEQ